MGALQQWQNNRMALGAAKWTLVSSRGRLRPPSLFPPKRRLWRHSFIWRTLPLAFGARASEVVVVVFFAKATTLTRAHCVPKHANPA